jgi:hypothetical protein
MQEEATIGAEVSSPSTRGRDQMGWIILIILIVLVLALIFSTGIDLDWTDFLHF